MTALYGNAAATNPSRMKPRILTALLAICLSSGVARAEPATDAPDDDLHRKPVSASHLPKVDLTPQLLHQFLVAEIAGQRGQIGLAVSAYRDLAKATRDPRVAQRAAEIALFARQYDAALESARIWSEVDPDSSPARQALAGLLAATGRSEELAGQVAKILAAEKPNVGPALLRLPRMFARTPDKAAVQRIIDEATTPYLGVPEAHYARAVAALEAQDGIRAMAESQRALALRPDWEQAALLHAQATPGRTEVIDDLRNFVTANPGAREARLALARTLVGEKRFEEARREFAELLTANPDNGDVIYAVAVLSLQLNEVAPAEKHLKRLVEMGYAEANSARLYLGQIAEERKRWDEAVQWYAQITPGQQYLQAQLRIASSLAQQGRLDDARARLQGAPAANPTERAQLLVGEAQLLREAGRQAESYAVLEAGLVANPNQPELLYESALAAEKLGRNEVLERNLRQLIQIKPDHAHAYNALGYSLADRNERLDEAQQLVDKALALSPDDPFILDSKGWVQFRKGDHPGALETLQKAYATRPDPEIAAHLGEVLWMAGRRDEAQKTWAEAARVNPGNDLLTATIKRFKP
jgi:tetratricopeptide (TPR) repeat protein